MRGAIITLFLSCAVMQLNLFCTDQAEGAILSEFSFSVHRRYYFIERLKLTIQLLTKVKEQINQVQFLVRRVARARRYEHHFLHPKIRENINEIIRTRSLKPLLSVWDDFTMYKALDDDLFVDEFTQEIFIVTKSVLLQEMIRHNASCGDIFACEVRLTLPDSVEERLDRIDAMNMQLHQITLGQFNQYQLIRSDDLYDVASEVSSERVLQRFYHIRRLIEHREILSLFGNYGLLSFTMQEASDAPLPILNAVLERLLSEILERGDTHALCQTIDDFQQFKHLADRDYTNELVKVVLAVYVHALLPIQARSIVYRVSQQDIREVITAYQEVNQLPLEELLKAIDLAAKLLKKVIHEESQNSSLYTMLGSGSWWFRSAAIFSLLVRLARHYFI